MAEQESRMAQLQKQFTRLFRVKNVFKRRALSLKVELAQAQDETTQVQEEQVALQKEFDETLATLKLDSNQQLAQAREKIKQVQLDAQHEQLALEKQFNQTLASMEQDSSQRMAQAQSVIQQLEQEIESLTLQLQILETERASLRAMAKRGWQVVKSRVQRRWQAVSGQRKENASAHANVAAAEAVSMVTSQEAALAQ